MSPPLNVFFQVFGYSDEKSMTYLCSFHFQESNPLSFPGGASLYPLLPLACILTHPLSDDFVSPQHIPLWRGKAAVRYLRHSLLYLAA